MLVISSILSFFSNPFGFIQKIVIGFSSLVVAFTIGLYEGHKYTVASEKASYEIARQVEQKHQIEVQLAAAERETQLIKKNQELESLLNDIEIEGSKSSTANSVSLPADSVRRIDKVR